MSWQDELDRIVEARADPAGWMRELAGESLAALREEARRRLRALPTPMSERVHAPEQRVLERILGWCEVLGGGSPARLLAAERVIWLRGGDHLVYLRRLREFGRAEEADALARFLEARKDVEAYMLDDAPEGFLEALSSFGDDPDPATFDALLAKVPEERRTAVLRLAIRELKKAGVEGDALFLLAAMDASPVALELVDEGSVSPETVLRRADVAPAEVQPMWWAIAGRAAFVQGDQLGCVRHLRRAFESGLVPSTMTLPWLWKRADDDLKEMLRKAGLPVPS